MSDEQAPLTRLFSSRETDDEIFNASISTSLFLAERFLNRERETRALIKGIERDAG